MPCGMSEGGRFFNPITDFKPLVAYFLNLLKFVPATRPNSANNMDHEDESHNSSSETVVNRPHANNGQPTGANAIPVASNGNGWQQQQRGTNKFYCIYNNFFEKTFLKKF